MTTDRMALIELIEKGADGDLVRDMLDFAAARIMEVEVQALTGVAHGVRDPAGRFSVTVIASVPGKRGWAGSTWKSHGCERAATSLHSWRRAAPLKRR